MHSASIECHTTGWAWAVSLRPVLRGLARRLVAPQDVDDIVHEAMLRLATRASSGRLRPDLARNSDAWTATIARRVLRDVARPLWRRDHREATCADPEAHLALVHTEDLSATADWRSWGMGPIDGFVFVALHAPDLIIEDDVVAAVRASRAPSVGLSRDADTTWRLFEAWRLSARRDDRDLFFILRSTPSGRWDERQARRARDWAHQRVRRARVAARTSNVASLH